MTDQWDTTKCNRAIKTVCKQFGVRPCRFTFHPRSKCYYDYMTEGIFVGRKSHWPVKAILAHELSHHIDAVKNKPVEQRRRKLLEHDRFGRLRRQKTDWHGKRFQEILGVVISLIYDQSDDYPWGLEYPAIQKARKAGRI